MKLRRMKRLLCILMTLCLLPALALAETAETAPLTEEIPAVSEPAPELSAEDELPEEEAEPAIPEVVPDPAVDYASLWPAVPDEALRAKYQLTVSIDPAAFPGDTSIHYADWAAFLDKLSLSGDIDIYGYARPDTQLNHTGWLNLNGKPLLSLDMDAVAQHRYLRSNACKNDTVFFHMDNFLEFMTKPSYFGMDLKPASLLLYPAASMYLVETYEDCFAPYFTGEGTRIIPHEQLVQLCGSLNELAPQDNHANRLYRVVNNLLDELRISITAYERLGSMDEYLAFLDPEKKGMLITAGESCETYEIGGRTLLSREWTEDSSSFTLTLPYLTDGDEGPVFVEGSLLTLTYENRPGEASGRDMDIRLTVEAEGEITMELALSAKGLPTDEEPSTNGTLRLTVGGSYLRDTHVYDLAFSTVRTDSQLEGYEDNHHITLSLLSAANGLPGLTVTLTADTTSIPASEMKAVKLRHDLPDFFRLNESVIREYVDLYGKSAVLTLMPLVLEVPAGIINDIYTLVETHDILPTLGIW